MPLKDGIEPGKALTILNIEKLPLMISATVILTLSSDEDEDPPGDSIPNSSLLTPTLTTTRLHLDPPKPIVDKEPIISLDFNNRNYYRRRANYPGSYFGSETKSGTSASVLSLPCRSLRIGSYKVVPNDRVLFAYQGRIQIMVPPFAHGEKDPVTLTLNIKNVVKILAHFGSGLQVLFIYLTPCGAEEIRMKLKMLDKNYYYFDPSSYEESQRRITLLPEKMKADKAHVIRNILNFELFNLKKEKVADLFEELTMKEANEILVRSSPSEVEMNRSTYETVPLFVYPPPPNKGGITLTTDDYCCLGDEQFLNDVLIDFYLKWLHSNKLSAKDCGRTHIFSSFFYKRLTAKPKNGQDESRAEGNSGASSAALRRHERVKSWTKNVDIFAEDFILIPINERFHWLLAVICFPGLNRPVRMCDNEPVSPSDAIAPVRKSGRFRKKLLSSLDENDSDFSDRDEAQGDDEEMEDYSRFLEDSSEPKSKRIKEDSNSKDAVKQPCILIFDSLSTRTRSNIVATLREYLEVEYFMKKKKARSFSKVTMPGARPKVPQQMNYWDCGIFVLQFAEQFFEKPLNDFRLPIRALMNWFHQDVATGKREEMAKLVQSLLSQYKPNHSIRLPSIQFSLPSEKEVFRNSRSEARNSRSVVREAYKGIELQDDPLPKLTMPSLERKISINLISRPSKAELEPKQNEDVASSLLALSDCISNSNTLPSEKCECGSPNGTKVTKYVKPDYIKQLEKLKSSQTVNSESLRQLVNYSDSSSDDEIFIRKNQRRYQSRIEDESVHNNIVPGAVDAVAGTDVPSGFQDGDSNEILTVTCKQQNSKDNPKLSSRDEESNEILTDKFKRQNSSDSPELRINQEPNKSR